MQINGNIQPDKGKNKRLRIDGTAALLNAYTILELKKGDYVNMIQEEYNLESQKYVLKYFWEGRKEGL